MLRMLQYSRFAIENRRKSNEIIVDDSGLLFFVFLLFNLWTKRRSSGKPVDENISCKFVEQWPPF
jgi:hypothetical protein